MRLIYVDESGRPNDSEWLILSAFIVDSDNWSRLEPTVKFGVGEEVWHAIDSLKEIRKPGSSDYDFDQGKPLEISRRVYGLLSTSVGYHVIGVIINQDLYNPPHWSNLHDDPYIQAYTFLLERIEMYLGRKDKLGMVIVESRGRDDDQEVLDAHERLRREGTQFIDFANIVEVSFPLNDDYSLGLQLADWVATAIRSNFITDRNTEFYGKIKPHIDTGPDGDIIGAGIKIYPDNAEDRLHNL